MATPLSADRFLSALKGAGLGVVEHGRWRTHNRNTQGNWGPVNGVMIHHTGPYSSEDDMVELCRVGYRGLPGPLCHGVIDRSGTVHLVGYGRTNHAGMGDTDVLLAVIAEKETLPRDNEADTDGNRHFYGFECVNTGSQSWPAAQLDAMARAAAAVCRAHGWTERSVIGHKEWQPGKPDPGGIDMADFRDRVATHLKGAAKPPTKPKPDPKPKPRRYAAYPGPEFFRTGRSSPVIAAMAKRLIAEECSSFDTPPGPVWTEAHRRSYAAYQIKNGYQGSDADGIPGKTTWAKLRVPHQSAPGSAPRARKEKDVVPPVLADVAERTIATYVQSMLGLLAAASTTDILSLSVWESASVAAVPAALSVLKSCLGTVLGRRGTASWLPLHRDPATPR
ncbi:N-acetylmuramoyl-L-alanine amidase [Streptomyces jumonjinensis]|uniref:N-acetylmuramoyl-L-alanine amidase n=1 Tax=Streptomyces jumonjinensis TaxID=1945 RepID=A0A646KWQ1_STRJU|nr:N-acetylmuramoyl-L-alanine amidase [Streptomyces jumonjinensis]